MPRVWKHFLKNLAWPAGIVAYITAVSFGASYGDTLFAGGSFTVVMIFVVLPAVVYLVRDMWIDAKKKVERENREMMRTLKGSKYDF